MTHTIKENKSVIPSSFLNSERNIQSYHYTKLQIQNWYITPIRE